MIVAPPGDNEERRLSVLEAYQILDTEAEAAFDELTQLASYICQTPIALVSLVDDHRQWFKAKVGLDATETPRDVAFCAHAIQQDDLFVVGDATQDERFHDNPLVVGAPHVRFYAGMPLVTPSGEAVGTLCAIDSKPRDLSAEQLAALRTLGRQVVGQLELRLKLREVQTANVELDRASKFKSQFLANMSHEIRTPMNGVIGMTGLLLKSELTERQREFAEIVRSSGEHLLTLINDVLDFSKIEADKVDLEEAPFEIVSTIEDVLSLFTSNANDKELELYYLVEPDVPAFVTGDVTRLRQILANLLGNAVKFTESGEISVKATRVGDEAGGVRIRFAVIDTGSGIPPDRLDRLFKAFSQVDASTTRKHGGTGLGLVISRRLSELMGGRMWAESVEGEGSTFLFEIVVPVAPPQPKHFNSELSPHLRGRTVLVVDDSWVNVRMLTLTLEGWGMRPSSTLSPAEALDWVKSGRSFDVAVVDYQMPGMNGVQLGRNIRRVVNETAMPMVLFSSGEPEEQDGAKEMFSAFLTKPIRQRAMHAVLTGLLGGVKAQAEDSTAAEGQAPDLASQAPLQILVAEDSRVNQQLAKLLLEGVGYDCDIVADGKEALSAVSRIDYDLVLMDCQMPEMDGYEATREIRRQRPDGRPYIVAVTANALDGDREKCLEAGMDDYVSKPIVEAELTRVLRLVGRRIGASARVEAPAATASVEQPDPELFDSKLLDSLGETVGKQLAATFIEEARSLVDEIASASAAGKTEELGRAAHKLKGTSSAIGASGLAGVCASLQERPEDASLVDWLRRVLERTLKAI